MCLRLGHNLQIVVSARIKGVRNRLLKRLGECQQTERQVTYGHDDRQNGWPRGTRHDCIGLRRHATPSHLPRGFLCPDGHCGVCRAARLRQSADLRRVVRPHRPPARRPRSAPFVPAVDRSSFPNGQDAFERTSPFPLRRLLKDGSGLPRESGCVAFKTLL